MATTRRPAKGGQLLLLAALLLGIVTMHTLGHPTGHGGGSEPASARHEMTMTGAAPAEHGGTHARPAVVAVPAPAGMSGMDPLSVCLGVLGAFTLVLLLRAGLLRPGGFVAYARPLDRLLDGLRPNPPPPRILLSRLSVLRI